MKKLLVAALVVTITGVVGFSQTTNTSASSSAKNQSSVNKSGKALNIESGTQIAAELQKNLNVERAKVGDQVLLKTTKAVKQNGETVIEKGSTLVGRVTEVQKRAKGNAESKVSILIDTLKQGKTTMPITAEIVSVMSAASRAAVNDTVFADTSATSTTRGRTTASGGQPSGGLLGGVTNTVGGVVNTATDTVGAVTGEVGRTTNTATGAVGGTLKGLTVSQSTDASASGGSTISMSGRNLNLEKGTTFNLAVSNSTSASARDGN
jgi:hypothetical protein